MRRVGFAVLTASALVAACGSSGGPVSTRSVSTKTSHEVTANIGTPVTGGTAYWAEQPLSPPNYIFPLVSGAYYSNENVNDFQTLMYRPLYW
jgi:peptide/nickel transport system substrate-binding protein